MLRLDVLHCESGPVDVGSLNVKTASQQVTIYCFLNGIRKEPDEWSRAAKSTTLVGWVCCTKRKGISPRSGRMTIAERLIAGIRTPHHGPVRETDG
jgi:hypothetical protein